MRKFILLLALASVVSFSFGAASAQDRVRTGASSIDRHPQSRPPKTPEEVMARLSTSERALKLREADLETRKAFGKYQSVVAEAQRDGDPTDAAAAAVLGVSWEAATRQQISDFGADTDERAKQLTGVGKATRRAYDKFQDKLWRQQDLVAAAGTEAEIAAFGQATPAQVSASAEEPQDPAQQDN